MELDTGAERPIHAAPRVTAEVYLGQRVRSAPVRGRRYVFEYENE